MWLLMNVPHMTFIKFSVMSIIHWLWHPYIALLRDNSNWSKLSRTTFLIINRSCMQLRCSLFYRVCAKQQEPWDVCTTPSCRTHWLGRQWNAQVASSISLPGLPSADMHRNDGLTRRVPRCKVK